MEINLGEVPSPNGLSETKILYSESAGRFLVTVDPQKRAAFEKSFPAGNLTHIGIVTDSTIFSLRNREGDLLMEEDIFELKDCWKNPFGGLI